jgi:RNA recognition motif-containing protein
MTTSALSRTNSLDYWHQCLSTPESKDDSYSYQSSEQCPFYLPPEFGGDSPQSRPWESSEQSPSKREAPSVRLNVDEVEGRAIQLANLDPKTTESEIVSAVGGIDAIESIDLSKVSLGIAFVSFHDLRAAQSARSRKIHLHGRNVSIVFCPPEPIQNPEKPPNNGTLVLFHLRPVVTAPMLTDEFSPFGEVKEVRSAPGKEGQKFVEFWDKRAAEKAMASLKGKKVCGSKVSIEYSLPGGLRKFRPDFSGVRLPTVERPMNRNSTTSF